MPDSFKSLGEVFRSDPQLNNIRRIVKSSEVVLDFYKIFPDLEKVVKPQKVDKMFLKIRVENAVWRSELKFRELEIVKRINNYYNEERIKGIKFTN
ncbi:MAG: DciA family protein [Ignavibacteria bacterium]|nr:DciA family protein [Ignavibacteria bacterium]